MATLSSTRNSLSLLCSFSILILLLPGCTVFQTTKHNPEAKVGTVVLTPVGSLRAKKEFADAFETKAYQLLTEAVKGSLPPKYRKNIVVNNRVDQSVGFSDWFNPNQVDLRNLQGLDQDTLLVDYGFASLGLTNHIEAYASSGVLRADGGIGVIFIDAKTGKVVGRATSQAFGNWFLGDSDAFDTNGEFVGLYGSGQQVSSGQVDAALQRLMDRLASSAIRKITNSQ